MGGGRIMATLNVPATYATITLAYAAALAGDEIVIAPGSYLFAPLDIVLDSITIRGSTGIAADVQITHVAGAVDAAGYMWRVTGLLATIKDLSLTVFDTGAVWAIRSVSNVITGMKFENLIIKTSCNGIWATGTGSEVNRVDLEVTRTIATGVQMFGIYCDSTGTAFTGHVRNNKVWASVGRWFYAGIWAYTAYVRNNTVYCDETGWTSPLSYGIYGGRIDNCICQIDNFVAGTQFGIRKYYSEGSNASWVVGAPDDVTAYHAAAAATSVATLAIAASAQPLMILPPSNMKPGFASLAFNTANPAKTYDPDLAGINWAAAPSMGAYQSTAVAHDPNQSVLNNLANLNNLNNLS